MFKVVKKEIEVAGKDKYRNRKNSKTSRWSNNCAMR